MINIVAIGFRGIDGIPGPDGGPGIKGIPGTDADCGFWDDNEPTRGGDGSRGGDGGSASAGSNGGIGGSVRIEVDEYRGGILTELLQEMDGVKELKNVMIIGATNKPFALDSAILRPGRFDKIVYIPPPDAPARVQLFAGQLAKFLKGLDLNKLAAATDGFTGADIASICQEVKMQVVRERLQGKQIAMTNNSVLQVVTARRPSVTPKDLKEYYSFMQEYGERK